MNGQTAALQVRHERKFLENIIKDFKPEHADFRPVEGMMTVAQQIRHIAHTVRWFREGAFGAGFDMDFERMNAEMREPCTLEAAHAELDAAYDEVIPFFEKLTEAELAAPMADNPIFGTAPRLVVIGSNADHTAHHRGALSVYLRLLGIVPAMVYAQ